MQPIEYTPPAAHQREPNGQRMYHATRAAVDGLLALGWSIAGRDPLRLSRGGAALVVRDNGIICEG